MKTLKSREFVQIKNQAKVIAQSLKEQEKKMAAAKKAMEELQAVSEDIKTCDDFIFNKYGVHIQEVVQREVTKSVDKNGKEVYKTEFKPTSNCVWNEEKKVYEVAENSDTTEDVVETAEEEIAAEEAGDAPVFGDNGEIVND